jgi:diadenosine tetraphosphatase ApaH/serine/threonine PP2A family protein phosphatase
VKIAVLSDIHSNIEALRACLDRARACGAERHACLGDTLGYGPDPVETLDTLLALPNLVSVIGNHDETVLGTGRHAANRWIEAVAEWTRERLRPAHFEYLRSLPYLHVERDVTYAHASVWNPLDWEYLLKPGQIHACLRAARTRLVFIGHVHVPAVFRLAPDKTLSEVPFAPGAPVALDRDCRYVINVGSVGQPRDENPAACFVMHDDAADTVTFERVPYDHGATAARIRAAGFHEFFAERLALGR